ncbi:MAG TPA: HAD family phosphatase [Bacillota bacterium]|nr:HAD family phosphatase [Bacillota bacterium]
MLQKMTAVVFDFNGTLLWDTPLHNWAWDIFLEKYGLPMTDAEKMERIHGKTNQLIFRNIFGELSEAQVEKYILEKEGIYQQLCIETGISLAPGITALWEDLRCRNIKFTIATASGPENIDFYFERYQLEEWFDYDLVVFNNGNIASKPDPEIFNIAIDRLQVSPEQTVIFEDSAAGLKAATAANVGKIYIVNSNADDYAAFPFEIITHFDQVDRSIFING